MPSNPKTFAHRVEALAEPALAAKGYELVMAEFVRRGAILRLYIDSAAGITLDDCAAVSRLVGDLLDAHQVAEEVLGGEANYTLEVSSPGLDRPLVSPAHFQRFLGHEVRVVAHARQWVGRLKSADAAGIELEVEGDACALPYGAIERARLVPQLSGAPTPSTLP